MVKNHFPRIDSFISKYEILVIYFFQKGIRRTRVTENVRASFKKFANDNDWEATEFTKHGAYLRAARTKKR